MYRYTRKSVEADPEGEQPPQGEAKGARLMEARRPAVCWQFKESGCRFGRACKFPHVCENCQGSHPKSRCPSTAGARKRPKLN